MRTRAIFVQTLHPRDCIGDTQLRTRECFDFGGMQVMMALQSRGCSTEVTIFSYQYPGKLNVARTKYHEED